MGRGNSPQAEVKISLTIGIEYTQNQRCPRASHLDYHLTCKQWALQIRTESDETLTEAISRPSSTLPLKVRGHVYMGHVKICTHPKQVIFYITFYWVIGIDTLFRTT